MPSIKIIKSVLNNTDNKYGKKWIYVLIIVILTVSTAVWWIVVRSGDDSNLYSNIRGTNLPSSNADSIKGDGHYDYTEAANHIGEKAMVSGTVVKVFTAKSGVTFFNFCEPYDDCPFSAVIFASDQPKFGDLSRYEGKSVTLTGSIKSYQGKAEMILSSPEQVSM